MPVVDIRLQDTLLYKALNKLSGESSGARSLLSAVDALCRDASDRLKAFGQLHPQYTLHDETHCIRVVHLMGQLLGTTHQQLNDVELAILILAAFFHDQGMVIDAAELSTLQGAGEWREWSATWKSEHPNASELSIRLSDPLLSEAEKQELIDAIAELDAASLSDYLRRNHGERSAKYVVDTYASDARLFVQGYSIASILAKVCRSHVWPALENLNHVR